MIAHFKTCLICLFMPISIGATHSEISERSFSSPIQEEIIPQQEQQLTKDGRPRKRKKKKTPVRYACDECKRRHVSCNEVNPGESCERCKRRQTECTWNVKMSKESVKAFIIENDIVQKKQQPTKMPLFFHFVLNKNPSSLAKNSATKSELGQDELKYIRRDTPYPNSAHYIHQTAVTMPLPEQTAPNAQPFSLPSQGYEHQIWAEEYGSVYSAGDKTAFDQYPYGEQTFYGTGAQTFEAPAKCQQAYHGYNTSSEFFLEDPSFEEDYWYQSNWQ